MKKYFISFVYLKKNDTWGFSNCIKTSLEKEINNSQIDKWNEEFENKDEFRKVTILFFKEIK